MDLKRRGTLALLITGSMAGGALGATVLTAGTSTAATNTTSRSASSGAWTSPHNGGRFVSNENPAHEKTESAQREAQENAGQFPTVP